MEPEVVKATARAVVGQKEQQIIEDKKQKKRRDKHAWWKDEEIYLDSDADLSCCRFR